MDQLIAGQGAGRSIPVVLTISLVLGLRHASDPDHLVAISTLVATERERPIRRAAFLGVSWGLGHATTLAAFGIPIVLLGVSLPTALRRAAEALVGVVITALAVRLLRRWRDGAFHAHEHVHGEVVHRHLHRHRHDDPARHAHRHAVRSPLQAYGIGLIHGLAGSAAVAVLLLAVIARRGDAVVALIVFALGTAISMAAMSAAVGVALGRERLRRRFGGIAPALGAFTLVFGLWYCAQAVA